jgi:two-component system sensor histidine kinase/response regulator
MNGVLGMAELLLETGLNDTQRKYAQMIRGSGEALLEIINDILDFSKIEAGKLELESIEFGLRDCVEQAMELMATRAHGKGLEIACRIDDSVPAGVLGDPGRLRQILLNLLGNAVKFTERGEVVLSVFCGERAAGPDACQLIFVVSDTGIGISPEAQQRLFQAFSQADGSTTRKYGGTGLGLAISKQLVGLMGGQIELESTLGKGTTFRITIPAAVVGAPAAPAAPRSDLHGLRLLIAEDNPTNRTILQHQASGWGMFSDCAADGAVALRLLREAAARREPYDLALIDMKMPVMDGLELAQAVKGDPALHAIPLIMLTSIASPGEAAAARNARVAMYLCKPVRQAELYNCIARVIGAAPVRDEVADPLKIDQIPLGASVLLAEDNPVNQAIALAMLKSGGCEIEVANNGREAVAAIARRQFSVVLMDCQMPELDGFGASREIREFEARRGAGSRTPIIALTANAMEGDRERCLANGMDDYLTKPFTKTQLYNVIRRWVASPADAAPAAVEAPKVAEEVVERSANVIDSNAFRGLPPSYDPIDQSALDVIRAAQPDAPNELLAELIALYLDDAPGRITAMRAAIEAGDMDALRVAAHTLKSSSAQLGAMKLSACCKELEELARAESLTGAVAMLSSLDREFQFVRIALGRMGAECSAQVRAA